MNLFRFLVAKENISGLSIRPDSLKLVYLGRASSGSKVLSSSEIKLSNGIIENGILKDSKAFIAAAASLLKKAKPRAIKFPYIIASLPQANTYSQLLYFPPLPTERLEEAVSVNSSLTLPKPLSEIYFDWQTVKENNEKTVILGSLALRSVVEPYIQALKGAGLQLIALEMPSYSLGRLVKMVPEEATLVISEEGQENVLFTVYYNRLPLFSRLASWVELGWKSKIENIDFNTAVDLLSKEVRRVHDYFTIEHPEIVWGTGLILAEKPKAQALAQDIEKSSGLKISAGEVDVTGLPSYDWLAAAGAAFRGMLPRKDDNINSLLPVGTEALYEQQKAISFLSTVRAIAFVVLGLYVAVYLGAFIFLGWLNSGLSKQVEQQSRLPVSPEATLLQNQAKDFNARVAELGSLPLSGRVSRAEYVKQVSALASSGITFIRLTLAGGEESAVNVQGVAQTRESLVNFRRQLEANQQISDIKLPIVNLALKENIPFSLTFLFKPHD